MFRGFAYMYEYCMSVEMSVSMRTVAPSLTTWAPVGTESSQKKDCATTSSWNTNWSIVPVITVKFGANMPSNM